MRYLIYFEGFNIEYDEPKTTFNIGEVRQLMSDGVNGYFLEYNGNFIGFSPDSDKPLYEYVERIVGEWCMKNSDEWSEYTFYNTEGESYGY